MDANSFYMVMVTHSMLVNSITETSTGGARAVMRGSLDCVTEASSAGVKVGSRTASEVADFEIEAVDDKKAGDKFAFTAFFDSRQAPRNHAIFGPKFTFSGELKSGDIVVKRVGDL